MKHNIPLTLDDVISCTLALEEQIQRLTHEDEDGKRFGLVIEQHRALAARLRATAEEILKEQQT